MCGNPLYSEMASYYSTLTLQKDVYYNMTYTLVCVTNGILGRT